MKLRPVRSTFLALILGALLAYPAPAVGGSWSSVGGSWSSVSQVAVRVTPRSSVSAPSVNASGNVVRSGGHARDLQLLAHPGDVEIRLDTVESGGRFRALTDR